MASLRHCCTQFRRSFCSTYAKRWTDNAEGKIQEFTNEI